MSEAHYVQSLALLFNVLMAQEKKGDFKHLYLLPEGMRLNRSCPGWDSIALLRHRVLAMSGSMKNVKSTGPGTEPSATLYLTILSV